MGMVSLRAKVFFGAVGLATITLVWNVGFTYITGGNGSSALIQGVEGAVVVMILWTVADLLFSNPKSPLYSGGSVRTDID